MMTLKDRSSNFQQRMARLLQTNKMPGTLGNGLGQIIDPLLPLTNALVRVQSSNGLSTQRSAILPGGLNLQMYDGEPIYLAYDFKRTYTIVGPNAAAKAVAGTSSVAVAAANISSSTPQSNFETLRLIAKTGLIVSLKSWNIIQSGVYYQFQFPDIDLTSSVPAAGMMLYAVIAVLSDLSNVEVAISTARSVSDVPLGTADVNEAIALLSAGSTETWAVKLIGGQTLVSQDDISNDAQDLRQIVNSKNVYAYTPSGSADTAGVVGDLAFDNSYIYVKAAGGWRRSALSTF